MIININKICTQKTYSCIHITQEEGWRNLFSKRHRRYVLHYRYLLLKSVPNFTQDCKYLTFGVNASGYIINKNYVMVPHHTWI